MKPSEHSPSTDVGDAAKLAVPDRLEAWRRVWEGKGAEGLGDVGSPEALLRSLLVLGGYDAQTSTLSLADFQTFVVHLVEWLEIGMDETVYEVGCGAGAVLHVLRNRCRATGGLDYAPSLAAIARQVLPEAEIDVGSAEDLDPRRPYDHVISVGAFLYFPSHKYAATVLARMLAKARRGIAVFDVNDAGKRDLAETLREQWDRKRPPELSQLFIDRDFFTAVANRHGCDVSFEDCTVTSSLNASYRYNVKILKP